MGVTLTALIEQDCDEWGWHLLASIELGKSDDVMSWLSSTEAVIAGVSRDWPDDMSLEARWECDRVDTKQEWTNWQEAPPELVESNVYLAAVIAVCRLFPAGKVRVLFYRD